MAGFSNATIKAKARGKPHIVFVDGYWRVSPIRFKDSMPLAHYEMRRDRWGKAHAWAGKENAKEDRLSALKNPLK